MIDSEKAACAWLEECDGYDLLAKQRLERLADLLAEENARQNLVSSQSLANIWRRHIADSAQLLAFAPRGPELPWLDLGTGAGFPGLVIAILRPELEVLMVESRAKRCEWLDRTRIDLGLDRAKVLHTRLERLESRQVGVISARAFAPLDKLLALSARFSTEATIWLLPKGRSAEQELCELRGWRHVFHVKQSLTDPDAGIIVGHLSGRKGEKF